MGEGKNLIGVDIGSSAIKVCQIKEGRKGLSLQRCAFVPLPPQTIVDGQVVEPAKVVDALKRAIGQAKIRRRAVALSVSGQSVIIRKISVPLMTAEELSEQISWEAEQHIPFDIKDVQVDYQVLRKRPEDSQMDLLLVAAKKDQIHGYAQLARDAKLKPIVVDIDAFTVQNLFEVTRGMPQGQTVALINLGATMSTLNIVTSGVSAFTREIASGGNAITQELQRQLQVPFEYAESLKCGVSPDGRPIPPHLPQLMDPVLDSIAAEIQRSLDFFMATSGEGEIAQVYVTGGTANVLGLVAAVERRVRVPTQAWSPIERFALEAAVDRAMLQQRQAQFAVALGLALRKDKEQRP